MDDNKLYVEFLFLIYLTPKHKKGRAVRAAQRGTTARSTERGAHAKAGVAECKAEGATRRATLQKVGEREKIIIIING